jgi:hypothetical protein
MGDPIHLGEVRAHFVERANRSKSVLADEICFCFMTQFWQGNASFSALPWVRHWASIQRELEEYSTT